MLYVLNILDILFTIFLIRIGAFVETNILMQPIINNPILGLIINIILPLLLILYIFIRVQKATIR